jgi:hypothetical protein
LRRCNTVERTFLSRLRARHPPRGKSPQGATGRGCLLRNQGGGCPPRTGCLSAPASAASLCPGSLFGRFARPLGGLAGPAMQPLGGRRLRAIAGVSIRQRASRASWISGHLALLPGAGRLHVGCRMAPSTSRRSKRRRYCIRQLRAPGDKFTTPAARIPAGMVYTALTRRGTAGRRGVSWRRIGPFRVEKAQQHRPDRQRPRRHPQDCGAILRLRDRRSPPRQAPTAH